MLQAARVVDKEGVVRNRGRRGREEANRQRRQGVRNLNPRALVIEEGAAQAQAQHDQVLQVCTILYRVRSWFIVGYYFGNAIGEFTTVCP